MTHCRTSAYMPVVLMSSIHVKYQWMDHVQGVSCSSGRIFDIVSTPFLGSRWSFFRRRFLVNPATERHFECPDYYFNILSTLGSCRRIIKWVYFDHFGTACRHLCISPPPRVWALSLEGFTLTIDGDCFEDLHLIPRVPFGDLPSLLRSHRQHKFLVHYH